MNEAPLRGILYGHGHMGQFHAAKLAVRPDVQFTIIDPRVGFREREATTPDFAIVATPTKTHAEVAEPLLQKGVPCLIEKPLAATIQAAEDLAQFDHVCVGHIERFNPVFRTIQNVQPEYIEIERLSTFPDRSTDVDVIADLMIHDLDLISRFMPGTIVDIRAKGVGVMGSGPDMVNARLEIELPQNRIGVINLTASRVSPKKVRTWRLIEPERYWSLDLASHEVKVVHWANQQMTTQHIPVAETDALTAQHNAFFQAIRQNRPFPCTGHEAVRALQLAERIRACLH